MSRVSQGFPRCRGAILIFVLTVFSMLSLLVLGLCHRLRMEMKTSRMESSRIKRAGTWLWAGSPGRAPPFGRTRTSASIISVSHGTWRATPRGRGCSCPGQPGTAEQDGAAAWLSYAVSDEEGRLNVNTSSPRPGWACRA